ncbi:MAG: ribosome silencing factor [Candidatus Melainabacteria bacterium]
MTQSTSQNPPATTHSPLELARLAAGIADSKKAKDLVVLSTGNVSYLADYFVICTGESKAQIRTIADAIEQEFKALGQTLCGQERDQQPSWCLLDYGDVVIHVMSPDRRDFYQLEHFWNHADTLPEESWQAKQAS